MSQRDFVRWLHTDTPYPNPSFREIVGNPFYVVHELVEIHAVRGLGLRLTKDVILRHMREVNDAHLKATRVEFEVAAREGALRHLAMRYRHLEAWCRDPLLTPGQRRRYESLRRRWRTRLRSRPARSRQA